MTSIQLAENAPAIACDALCKAYRRHAALQNLTLTVSSGEAYLLTGPNGSGKTTLLRLICGLGWPDSGRISIMGTALGPLSTRVLSRVSYVPADGGYYPNLTVIRNINLAADLSPRAKPPDISRQVARGLGLTSMLDRRAVALSKGQKKRLAIACALARLPEVLILDEPFAHIDVPTSRKLMAGLLESCTSQGLTILMSTLAIPPQTAIRTRYRVGVLNAGRITRETTVDGPLSYQAMLSIISVDDPQ